MSTPHLEESYEEDFETYQEEKKIETPLPEGWTSHGTERTPADLADLLKDLLEDETTLAFGAFICGGGDDGNWVDRVKDPVTWSPAGTTDLEVQSADGQRFLIRVMVDPTPA